MLQSLCFVPGAVRVLCSLGLAQDALCGAVPWKWPWDWEFTFLPKNHLSFLC